MMKGMLLSIGFCLLLLSAAAQNGELSGSGPLLVLLQDTANYGIIMYNSDGKISLPFVNQGDEPLVIESCKTSCGCLVPDCTKEPIAPGDTSFLRLHYYTNRMGPFRKTTTMRSNCRENPLIIIPVLGEVRQPGPDMVLKGQELGTISQLPIPDTYITLINRGDEPLVVDSCQIGNHNQSYTMAATHAFTITCPTQSIPPGDSLLIKATLTQPPQDTGYFFSRFTLFYNGQIVDSCNAWIGGVWGE